MTAGPGTRWRSRQTPDPRYAYIFGISQSGWVITTMIYQGFHVDERGRMVFEGARPDVPGGGKGAFNYRWGQTTHHPKHIEANAFPADHFPFNFTTEGAYQVDPYRTRDGVFGDVLAVAKRLGKLPEILLVNHETEYWTRAASLVHTDVFGTRDALSLTHPNVRMYMINGSQHSGPSPSTVRTNAYDRHSDGYVSHQPIGRALLVALDRWVSQGGEPPRSTVPLLETGEPLTVSAHAARFFSRLPEYARVDPTTGKPLLFPAARNPGVALKPPRADYGSRFFMPMPRPWDSAPVRYPGLQDTVPPAVLRPALRDAGAGLRQRRQRDRRHPAAGAGHPARHLPGLEPPLRHVRGLELPAALRRVVLAVRADRSRAERHERPPSVDRGAVRREGRLRRQGEGRGGHAPAAGVPAGGR
jgi:hypothetical protein